MASIREAFFNFRGDADDLIRELRKVQAAVRETPKRRKVQIEAETEAAQLKINALREVIEELEHETTDVKIAADLRKLYIDLARAHQIINTLPERKTTTVELKHKLDRDMANAERLINRVIVGFGGLARSTSEASHAGFNFTDSFTRSTSVIRKLGPLVAGLAIIFTTALVPAIAATIAAMGGLVGAVAGLGSALVAGLGPAALLLVGVFQRIGAVMQAFQSRKQAMESATRTSAAAARQEAAAQEQLRNSHNAVRDAEEGVTTAAENLTQARKAASDAIRDARRAEQDAIAATADAVENLREAEVQAYREIEDAIHAARRAQLDLADAQLGIERADLALDKARLALKEFREEAGLAGEGFNSLFKKFTDVDFDPGRIDEGLAGAVSGLDTSQLLELRELLLDVREAEHGVRESVQREREARVNANRTQAESNRLQRTGIAGVKSYQTALDGLASAQRTQAEASRRVAELERQGIARSPSVVAAARGVRDADQRLVEARRDLAAQTREVASAEKESSGAAALYEEQRKKLTATERTLLDLMIKLERAWELFRPLTDRVIGGINAGLDKLIRNAEAAPAVFDRTAKAIRESIDSMFANLQTPQNILNFSEILDFSPDTIARVTDIINGLVNAVLRLGAAALPLANDFLGRVAADINRLSATPLVEMRNALRPMFELLTIVYDTFIAMGEGVLATFRAGSKPINEFFKYFRDGARQFLKFAKSSKGADQIKEFFEDTLPFVKSLIETFKLLGAIFFKVFQIMAPILKPVLDTFNFFLKVILFLLRALDWLIGPFKPLIGWFVALTVGVNKILTPLRWLSKLLTLGGKGIFTLVKAFGRGIGAKLVAPFRNAWRVIKNIWAGLRNTVTGRAIISTLRSTGGTIIRVITWPFRMAWRLVRIAFNAAKSTLGRVLNGIVEAFKWALDKIKGFVQPLINIAKRVFNGWKNIFSSLGNVLSSAFSTGLRAARTVINVFINGMNKIIGLINKIPDIDAFGVKIGIPDIPKIPKLALGGVAKKATLGIFGEAGDEAVLPLTRKVYDQLARGILRSLESVGPTPAFAGGYRSPRAVATASAPTTVEQHFHVPPAPGGQEPDPRYVASQLARMLSARGLG